MRHALAVGLLITTFCSSCSPEPLAPEDLPETSSPQIVAEVLKTVEPEDYLNLFEYDQSAPLNFREQSRSELKNGTLITLSYSSPKGGRVPALMVIPKGQGPFPAIIIQHGSLGHKEDHLDLAEFFAGFGAVSFLIDDPYSRPGGWKTTEYMGSTWPYYTAKDLEIKIQTINDLQRAVDYLSQHPQIDPDRLAYLGISYGAAMGGLLAGVETRIKAYVLNVGDGGLVEHSSEPGPDGMNVHFSETWAELMWPTESLHFVSRAAPAALLFQNGLHDENVQPADAVRYQLAGSEPKTIRWYESDHFLPAEAYYYAAEWLQPSLGEHTTWFTPYYRPSAVLLDRLFSFWIGLVTVSLGGLLTAWVSRRDLFSLGNHALWALTTIILGPIGLGMFLFIRPALVSNKVPEVDYQVLQLTALTTTASLVGLAAADIWSSILPSIDGILLLTIQYLTLLLIVWGFYRSLSESVQSRPTGTLLSVNLTFALTLVIGNTLAAVLGLGLEPDFRILWPLAITALLSIVLSYPLHLWLIRLGAERWIPANAQAHTELTSLSRISTLTAIMSICLSYVSILVAIVVIILQQSQLTIAELIQALSG